MKDKLSWDRGDEPPLTYYLLVVRFDVLESDIDFASEERLVVGSGCGGDLDGYFGKVPGYAVDFDAAA